MKKWLIIGMLIPILLAGIIGSSLFYAQDAQLFIKKYLVPDVAYLEAQINIYLDQIYDLNTKIWGLQGQLSSKDRQFKEREKIWLNRIDELLNERADLGQEIELLKEQQVDRVKGEWAGLRDFKSLEELMQFLIEDQTDKIVYVPEKFDCDDYAATLMRNAAEEGFRVYYTRWVLTDGNNIFGFHRSCEAIVEMERPGIGWARWIVWVEPQTDEIIILGLEDMPETWKIKLIPFLP